MFVRRRVHVHLGSRLGRRALRHRMLFPIVQSFQHLHPQRVRSFGQTVSPCNELQGSCTVNFILERKPPVQPTAPTTRRHLLGIQQRRRLNSQLEVHLPGQLLIQLALGSRHRAIFPGETFCNKKKLLPMRRREQSVLPASGAGEAMLGGSRVSAVVEEMP